MVHSHRSQNTRQADRSGRLLAEVAHRFDIVGVGILNETAAVVRVALGPHSRRVEHLGACLFGCLEECVHPGSIRCANAMWDSRKPYPVVCLPSQKSADLRSRRERSRSRSIICDTQAARPLGPTLTLPDISSSRKISNNRSSTTSTSQPSSAAMESTSTSERAHRSGQSTLALSGRRSHPFLS
jgi:hypothetical protein